MKRPFLFSIILAALATTGFAATTTASGPQQVIRIGNGAEPKDLDPHIVTGVPEFRILQNLFESLVGKDPKTLKPIPAVAEKWTISKDGKVYTFTLRKDAKWSNGDAITAKDFVYSWTRLLTPATASEYSYQAYYIKNGRPFNEGKIKDASQLGLKALNDYTLEVTLESPTPFFLSLLYHHSLLPVHKASIEKFGAAWTKPGNLVSNGPFQLKSWEMNKNITLVKNPNYWDAKNVKLAEVQFFPIEKMDTEEKMFRTNMLHMTYEVPLDKIPFWKKEGSGSYQNFPYLGTYFYRLNVTKAPLNDKRVRTALNLAIDREKIVQFVTQGDQVPATTFTPPGTAGYTAKPVLPSNLSQIAKAKELLKQAGFPDGKGMPPVEILYNTAENHKKIAEAVQAMWKQNLGINARLVNQEWKVYLDSQRTLNYQISRAGWIGDYNDPNTFLDMFVTDGGNNETGWSNKEYDGLIAAAAKEMNVKKRLALFQKAENILLEELPVLPIYIYKRTFLKSSEVVGITPNIEDIIPLKYVSMRPREIAAGKSE